MTKAQARILWLDSHMAFVERCEINRQGLEQAYTQMIEAGERTVMETLLSLHNELVVYRHLLASPL